MVVISYFYLWLLIFVYKSFCGHLKKSLFDEHLRVELVGHMVGIFFGSPSGCTIFSSCQQDIRIPVSLHPSRHLVLEILILAIPAGILLWFYFAVLLMTNNVDHLFMCLSAISTVL